MAVARLGWTAAICSQVVLVAVGVEMTNVPAAGAVLSRMRMALAAAELAHPAETDCRARMRVGTAIAVPVIETAMLWLANTRDANAEADDPPAAAALAERNTVGLALADDELDPDACPSTNCGPKRPVLNWLSLNWGISVYSITVVADAASRSARMAS